MRIRGKRLTRQQKIFLENKGYNHRDWLLQKNCTRETIYVNRNTKEIIKFNKGDK